MCTDQSVTAGGHQCCPSGAAYTAERGQVISNNCAKLKFGNQKKVCADRLVAPGGQQCGPSESTIYRDADR
jgi:hypothetical protein